MPFFRILALIVLTVSTASACQVPVFRYALERWPADYFLLAVFTEGEPDASTGEVVRWLEERTSDYNHPVNLEVVPVDVTQTNTVPELQAWFAEQPGIKAPTMVLFYPPDYYGFFPAWQGAVTREHAERVLYSPARIEILKRLVAGDSGVWLLIEGSDNAANTKAALAIESAIRIAKTEIELPEGVMTPEEADELLAGDEPVYHFDPKNVLRAPGVPLKIDFSLLRCAPGDMREDVFFETLRNVDAELLEKAGDQPLAFAIFGQGRCLGPFAAEELTEDLLLEVSHYLCGACSCEVKSQNPGMDIVMAANWDGLLGESTVVIDRILPPLDGIAALQSAAKPATPQPSVEAPPVVADPVEEHPLQRNLLLAVVAVFIVVAVGTAIAVRRKDGVA